MNPHKLSRVVTWCLTVSLMLSATLGILVCDRASAKSGNSQANNDSRRADKVSPDLHTKVRRSQNSHNDEDVKVILQLNGPASAPLATLLGNGRLHVRKQFNNLQAHMVELPLSVVEQLAAFPEVQSVSFDAPVQSFGHVSLTTGAAAIRSNNGLQNPGVDGTGIGIAILDSGMDTGHISFLDKNGFKRIAFSKDFTGENRIDDPFGHGTHVTAIAAGNGRIASAAYLGIAPNAKLINLRVLNSQGAGSVSAVLSALDWIMTNHATYNIRVVNMSLGTTAIQSYRFDPVCLAVRRVVDAGIVVAAAAGNIGKDSLGRKIYGAIHSPGIEPSAITVGAANTFGTASRQDDTVTTYSSRGPTRGYWMDY